MNRGRGGSPMNHRQMKTVAITGAASGLGRAFALAWAEKGWRVGILDIDMEGASETREMVREAGGEGEALRCDVSSLDGVRAAADHLYGLWGGVGVLVNNAGVGGGGAVGEIPIEDWEKVVGIDLWGVVNGCHVFIPRMKEQGGGHIVNVSSLAGLISAPKTAPYNVSKAAVVALTQTLKTELASAGIGVTVVCPPVVKTNILENTLDMAGEIDYDIAAEMELIRTAMDASRITPQDVAAMTVRAVERNRLYVIPGIPLRLSWLNARLSPSLFYGLSALLARRGLHEPVYRFLARRGWI
ncbi:MAG: SDR family NAD(P)-dependent oxidoreductase [Actinobacteria bacterium]|nr:MAG: SDR family NAD(P)-dependent oxidoreductase [Actinomycetota bacterium]